LYELFGENLPMDLGFRTSELETLFVMLKKGVNSPITASAGRFFDAVAAVLGLRQRSSFEGQAAMELEFLVEPVEEWYDGAACDWASIVQGVLDDQRRSVAMGRIAARFHNSLVEAIVGAAREVGEERVVLAGGCFQNQYLTERAIRRLREEGFQPYWHQRVPPNDGGIALGQAVAAQERLEGQTPCA
jgi:hydrogenase maturation protein HypF